jgi:hypothetical protein
MEEECSLYNSPVRQGIQYVNILCKSTKRQLIKNSFYIQRIITILLHASIYNK